MSLNYLGISHFPVLHRQFSSPTSSFSRPKPHHVSSSSQDLTQDSKDILIERLNDLVSRLSKTHTLADETVSTVHAEVDKIESIIRGFEAPEEPKDGFFPATPERSFSSDGDTFWGPPTPTHNFKMRLPKRNVLQNAYQDMNTSNAIMIAKEAEELAVKLAGTVNRLQARREESDHIHDLLVTRAEEAAERILLLEYRIAEMEEDFDHNQSELKYLRIHLQAIEVQASPHIVEDEDPELTESILNWKIDWENIEKRSKSRRDKCRLSVTNLGDSMSVA